MNQDHNNFRIIQSTEHNNTVIAIVKALDWWRNRNFENYYPLVLPSDHVVATWTQNILNNSKDSKKTIGIFRKLKDAKSFYKLINDSIQIS